jgi:hypothetical protein
VVIKTAGEGIRADRERALLSVAYDTMVRRAELVALDLEDFTFLPDGTGRVLIRRSKTDQAGEGYTAYLARETVRLPKSGSRPPTSKKEQCFGGWWGEEEWERD